MLVHDCLCPLLQALSYTRLFRLNEAMAATLVSCSTAVCIPLMALFGSIASIACGTIPAALTASPNAGLILHQSAATMVPRDGAAMATSATLAAGGSSSFGPLHVLVGLCMAGAAALSWAMIHTMQQSAAETAKVRTVGSTV